MMMVMMMMMMVWMMINDRTELADTPQLLRCPWLECWTFLNTKSLETIGIHHDDPEMRSYLDDSVEYVANMKVMMMIV